MATKTKTRKKLERVEPSTLMVPVPQIRDPRDFRLTRTEEKAYKYRNMLGYDRMSRSIEEYRTRGVAASKQNAEDALKKNRVLRAFDKAGIKPFDPAAVEAYRKKQATSGIGLQFLISVGASLMSLAFFAVAASMIWGTCVADSPGTWAVESGFAEFAKSDWGAACCAPGIIFGIIGAIVAFVQFPDFRTEYGWRQRIACKVWDATSLGNYHSRVPTYALNSALRLVEADEMLTGKIWVDELKTTRAHTSLDPFLYVYLATGERLYFEVWDEPKFTGHRQD